jgi:nucleotide-binding universal stress UspA family protein
MIKDILVNLPVLGSRDPVTSFAASVAARFGAHLTGVAFLYEPLMPVMVDMYGVPPDIIQVQRIENEKASKTAVARFDEAARLAGISGEAHALDAAVGAAPSTLARMARRFDLSVVAQPEPNQPTVARMFVEAALFETGRPLLIVPYIQTTPLKLDRIMLCWDGSRSAARAAGDAMPFFLQGKTIEIVMVSGEPTKSDELPGADIGHHLARHGIKAEVKRIASPEIDVANTILSYAADQSVDLLVMGGYGHSRLREFILGGVTRGILNSMTFPTLMSH